MTGILVIGASHGIGLSVVRAGLARGMEVRALARSALHAARAFAATDARPVTWIAGDARDPVALAQGIDGARAVIWTPGQGPTRKPVSLFSDSIAALVPVMEAAGVRRLLAVTGIGAGDTRGRGGFFYDRLFQPLLLATLFQDKDRAEALIKASTLDWTIVRPGFLNDQPARPSLNAITNPAAYRPGVIARASVAAWILDQIDRREFLRASPLLLNAG